jgi:putative transcriptional regulator
MALARIPNRVHNQNMKVPFAVILVLATLWSPGAVWPQAASRVRLSPGVLLVASRELRDPNFRQTVIVIADRQDEGALGLILNRRTDLKLSEILGKWKEAAGVRDPIFVGGPVGTNGMFALLRTKVAPSGAKRVTGDIHLVVDREGLNAHLAEGPDRVRLYAGYAGWEPGQLEAEIDEGGWHVLPANPKTVFDPDPDTLWARLVRLTELQLARN